VIRGVDLGIGMFEKPWKTLPFLPAVDFVGVFKSPLSAIQSGMFPYILENDKIDVQGAIRARPWTRRMPTAAAEPKFRARFSVRDFGMSICEPGRHLVGTRYVHWKNAGGKQLRR
jgi:hypothetical protein